MEYDPVELDLDVTPQSVIRALQEDSFGVALTLALRLNEQELVREAHNVDDNTTCQLYVASNIYLVCITGFSSIRCCPSWADCDNNA